MFENGAEIYQGDVLEPEKYFKLPQKITYGKGYK